MAGKKITRTVNIGNVKIGGDNPVSVQSMVNVPTRDFYKATEQIKQLQDEGCDVVRLAVPTSDDAAVFKYAKAHGVTCPLVADIHFDYRIALESVRMGVDKIRINPGNIGDKWKVREVAAACKSNGIPIRIGVNGGSLDKSILEKYGTPSAEALAESAFLEAEQLEDCGFFDIVISIKSSSIAEMTKAVRIVSKASDYPLHIGVTEAGDDYSGLIKSSVGIGSLLLDGIGDTIRVSLTADPIKEVYAGREILNSLGINPKGGVEIISCPTCGRTNIDLIGISRLFKEKAANIDTHGKKLKVAVMGCAVNGPGEAKEADFGIAGGDGYALFFKNGESKLKISEDEAVDFLIEEVKKAINK